MNTAPFANDQDIVENSEDKLELPISQIMITITKISVLKVR